MNNWYKIAANEYVGADANMSNGMANYDATTINQGPPLPPTINPGSVPDMGEVPPQHNCPDVPETCPVCKEQIAESEISYGWKGEDGKTVYKCNNCGHTNNPYKRTVEKHHSRLKRRRRSSSLTQMFRLAATPANPMSGGSYNNTANQPYGRLDLSEDERIMPYDRMQDGFDSEWDSNRQMNNKDYKVVKVKDKNGKDKYIRIRKRNTSGDGVSPANTYKNVGRVKRQNRYKPSKGGQFESAGSWPHNRNPGTEGWYGQYSTNNQDADMRNRMTPWDEYVHDRGTQFMGSFSKY